MRIIVLAAASAVTIAIMAASAPHAQQSPPPPITQGAGNIKRTVLQKFDVPGSNLETVIGVAEIGPNVASIGKHSHFGTEAGYVIDGEATLQIDGQPPKDLKAGDSYVIPAGVAHDARTGAKGAKVIATYVVEKGKPLAIPAK